jgi:HD-like signal output (HDOD) protein
MLSLFKKKNWKANISKLLEGYELPSFSTNLMNVLSMLRNPDSSTTKIKEKLQLDPGLHVKVLKVVNSAAFGLSSKVTNLQQAITLLGRARLEAITLSLATKNSLPTVSDSSFDDKEFWLAAARRATLAQTFALHFHPSTSTESFTAGFLQDMGILLIAAMKKNDYFTILEQWNNNLDLSLDDLERKAYGFDHPTVGAFLATEWNFPEYLVNVIAEHHNNESETNIEPAIRLSSYIRGNDNINWRNLIADASQKEFNLQKDETLELMNSIFKNAENFSQLLR